jgi:hypothetical protein
MKIGAGRQQLKDNAWISGTDGEPNDWKRTLCLPAGFTNIRAVPDEELNQLRLRYWISDREHERRVAVGIAAVDRRANLLVLKNLAQAAQIVLNDHPMDLAVKHGRWKMTESNTTNKKPGAATTTVKLPLLPFGPGGIGLLTFCHSWRRKP